MTIFNLGSINLDHFYEVPHLPQPGETLLATAHSTGLGGKGANQSVAAAQAGARVVHIGAVGPDGTWAINRLQDFGVNTSHVKTVTSPTAHAIINVDPQAENAIVVFSGANMDQSLTAIKAAFSDAVSGDTLLLQNETNLAIEAAGLAKTKGMTVVYSAAPFDADATQELLPLTDILILNAIEMQQLGEATGKEAAQLGPRTVVITEGSKGGRYITSQGEARFPAFPVKALDTTGAGDTHAGYFAAALHEGQTLPNALRFASAASALKVTKKGTADAIPSRSEVEAFLKLQS